MASLSSEIIEPKLKGVRGVAEGLGLSPASPPKDDGIAIGFQQLRRRAYSKVRLGPSADHLTVQRQSHFIFDDHGRRRSDNKPKYASLSFDLAHMLTLK